MNAKKNVEKKQGGLARLDLSCLAQVSPVTGTGKRGRLGEPFLAFRISIDRVEGDKHLAYGAHHIFQVPDDIVTRHQESPVSIVITVSVISASPVPLVCGGSVSGLVHSGGRKTHVLPVLPLSVPSPAEYSFWDSAEGPVPIELPLSLTVRMTKDLLHPALPGVNIMLFREPAKVPAGKHAITNADLDKNLAAFKNLKDLDFSWWESFPQRLLFLREADVEALDLAPVFEIDPPLKEHFKKRKG